MYACSVAYCNPLRAFELGMAKNPKLINNGTVVILSHN